MSETQAWRCGVRGHNEIRINALDVTDRPTCLEPVADYVCGLPMAPIDAVSLARITIGKYGAEARKPSVLLAKAVIEGAHERDRLRTATSQERQDTRRYQRLRILGCAPGGTRHLEEMRVLRFSNLDIFVDADIAAHPSRGEAMSAENKEQP